MTTENVVSLRPATALQFYDTAKQALAQARSIDEVKSIRDKAVAFKEYARLAGDRSLEADAYEIRRRAEREVGVRMEEERQANRRLRQGQRSNKAVSPGGANCNTLTELGIDRHLADSARRLAEIPAPEFDQNLVAAREKIANRQAGPDVLTTVVRQSRVTARAQAVTTYRRAYDARVKRFLDAIKVFSNEVAAARECRDRFSPEAAAFTKRVLVKLERDVSRLREELTNG